MEGAQNKSGTKAPQPQGFFHTEPKELSARARQSGQVSMSSYQDKLKKSKWASVAIMVTKVMIPLRIVCMAVFGSLSSFSAVIVQHIKLENRLILYQVLLASYNFLPLVMTPSFVFAAMNGPTPIKVLSFTAIGLSLVELVSGSLQFNTFEKANDPAPPSSTADAADKEAAQNMYFFLNAYDVQGLRSIDIGVHAAFWILHFF
jgi:hypothetical protein